MYYSITNLNIKSNQPFTLIPRVNLVSVNEHLLAKLYLCNIHLTLNNFPKALCEFTAHERITDWSQGILLIVTCKMKLTSGLYHTLSLTVGWFLTDIYNKQLQNLKHANRHT